MIEKTNKNFFSVLLLFFWFFTSIMDKLKWSIFGWNCDLYTIVTGIVFLLLVITSNFKLVFTKEEHNFFIFYLFSFLYILISYLFLDSESTFCIQHSKGLVSLAVEFLAFLNVLLFAGRIKGNRCLLLVNIFFIIGIINATYSFLQLAVPDIDQVFVVVFHSDTVRIGTDPYGAFERVSGFLLEANFNGPFLVLSIICGVYLFKNIKINGIKKCVIPLLIGYLTVALILTFSRTAYLGFAVFILMLYIESSITDKLKILVMIGLGMALFLILLNANKDLYVVIMTRFRFLTGESTIKEDTHFKILQESFAIIFDNLRNVLFGVGQNCLYLYFRDIFGYTTVNMKAHSHFVQILGEGGIIGLIMFLIYLIMLFKVKGTKNKKSFFRAMLISFIFMNLTYDPFTRAFTIIFIALFVFIERDFKEEKENNYYERYNFSGGIGHTSLSAYQSNK